MSLPIIILFSLSVIILSLAILALSYFYIRLNTRLSHTQKENIFLRSHLSEKSLEKVNIAREKSVNIITQALAQADELVKKAGEFKSDAQKDMRVELEELAKTQKELLVKASDDLKETFQNAVNELTVEDINIFRNVSKDIENVAFSEIKRFEKQLHDETVGQQSIVQQKIDDAFAKANFDIEEYKKEKYLEINGEINKVLEQVVKDVLGKRLDFTDHNELIMTALEKAKKDLYSS